MTITPIETRYAGCRFRSRLEARWAVFFDTLGIRWEYEPQGFAFTTHFGERFSYLPDFHLPDLGTWVEVKGSDDELNRGRIECAAINLPGSLLILGPIPKPSKHEWAWLELGQFEDQDGNILADLASDMWVGFDGSKSPAILRRCTETSSATNYEAYPKRSWLEPVEDMTRATAAHAYEAARSARFEHGETGATPARSTSSETDLFRAEQRLLTSMLRTPDQVEMVIHARGLAENDFADPRHALIFKAMLALMAQAENVTASTVTSELRKAGLLEQAGGVRYFEMLGALKIRGWAPLAYGTELRLAQDAAQANLGESS